MNKRLARLSHNQLMILKCFLDQPKQVLTQKQLEQKTRLRGKSLGGVLSALSRSRFRGINLIEPMGRSSAGPGLRWALNSGSIPVAEAKADVAHILNTY